MRSGFLRDVLTVLKGTVVAQLVAIAVMPVLARFFAPEAFGGYQIYLSTMTMLLVVVTLRYEIALLHARDENELEAGLALCVMLNVLVALAVAVIAWVWVAYWNRNPAFRTVALWLAPAVVAAGLAQTFSYAALWSKAYGVNAGARIAQSLGFAGISLLAGRLVPSAPGLIGADIGGRAAAAGVLAAKLSLRWRRYPALLRSGATRLFAREHWKFPAVALPAGLLSVSASVFTPVFVFAAFDLGTAGQYAMGERCVLGPVSLLGQAISQVFMSSFAEKLRTDREDAGRLLRTLIVNQLKLGIVPSIVLALGAPWIFQFVFGAEWHLAGEFVRWMSPLILAAFVITPINMAFILLSRQDLQLYWDAARLLATVVLWTLVAQWDVAPLVAIRWHVALHTISYIVFVWAVARECRRPRTVEA